MYVYHVTPSANVDAIDREGIDPSLSMGRLRVSWVCKVSRLKWAIAHIAKRHHLKPEQLVVYLCEVPRRYCVRFRRAIYITDSPIPPVKLIGTCPATTAVDYYLYHDGKHY